MTYNSDKEIKRIKDAIKSFANNHCIGLGNLESGSISDVPILFTYEGRTYSRADSVWTEFVKLASDVVPAGTSTLLCYSSLGSCIGIPTCVINTCVLDLVGDSSIHFHQIILDNAGSCVPSDSSTIVASL